MSQLHKNNTTLAAFTSVLLYDVLYHELYVLAVFFSDSKVSRTGKPQLKIIYLLSQATAQVYLSQQPRLSLFLSLCHSVPHSRYIILPQIHLLTCFCVFGNETVKPVVCAVRVQVSTANNPLLAVCKQP